MIGAVGPASPRRAGTGRLLAPLMGRPTFVLSAAVLAFWLAAAIAWRWLPIDPFGRAGPPFASPSRTEWLGTDRLGRSVFARLLAGSESVLVIAPLATLLATAAGTTIGLVAAWHRGVDEMMMRLIDVVGALPGILVVVLLSAAFGRSATTVVWSVAVLFAPLIARTVRAAALSEVERPYVDAARLRGERAPFILIREVLPNVAPAVAVEATVRLGFTVLLVSGLSFLGLGPQPPSPDWGLSVTENRAYLEVAPWTVLVPAFAIASLVVAVNLLADNLREVFDV
ncbi:ABC transporter permease [Desertimonas flava]|uniref:ABC transporter permease n=1 Tax=Desertimonas flava TaxID=2064846 RepID=UPI00187869DA|nr:ABC transporter permease [Desertimonas flava]